MSSANPYTCSVRLVDRRTRVVEVLGSEPLGSRWPTDRKLSFWWPQASQVEHMAGPQPVGHCFDADGRRALFLVNEGSRGDALLDLLARHPIAQARPAQPSWGQGLVGGGMTEEKV